MLPAAVDSRDILRGRLYLVVGASGIATSTEILGLSFSNCIFGAIAVVYSKYILVYTSVLSYLELPDTYLPTPITCPKLPGKNKATLHFLTRKLENWGSYNGMQRTTVSIQ